MARTRIVSNTAEDTEDERADHAPSPDDGGAEPGVAQPPPGCTEAEHYAWHLRESTSSILLHAAMAPTFKGIDSQAYKLHRDRLLADAGGPSDPIEVMIIEQLGLAHFCMGLMTAKATNAVHVNAAGTYAVASARLMAEFRRSALALQAYRHASRHLARDPARDVVEDGEMRPAGDPPAGKGLGDELGLRTEESDGGESIIPYPGPGGRAARPAEARRDHPGGPGAAPRRRAGGEAVGAVHRSAK